MYTTKELARLMLDNAKGNVTMPANFAEGEVKTPDEAISDAFLQVMGLTKAADAGCLKVISVREQRLPMVVKDNGDMMPASIKMVKVEVVK